MSHFNKRIKIGFKQNKSVLSYIGLSFENVKREIEEIKTSDW